MARKGRFLYPAAPKPVKLSKKDKEELMEIVESEIQKYDKLKEDIDRINIRAGRIYFYYHVELTEDREYAEGLEKGDILEYGYGRITIFDNEYNNCSLDWLRHTGKWFPIFDGNLKQCIAEMESSSHFMRF
ncbi:MAG: hypothetical protein LBM96_01035 [Methanobrevibacter sp.]|nr:hypothetical protein [Candidatus Methanoflexus mossambicus]